MKTIGGLIAGLLLVSGCARDVVPLPVVDPTQAGEIVVIYSRGVGPFPPPVTVTLDGQNVYRLACGEHVVLTVPVGQRLVSINHWPRADATVVSVSAGSRSHVRLVFPSFSRPRLMQTTPSDGERLMRDPWTKSSTPTSR